MIIATQKLKEILTREGIIASDTFDAVTQEAARKQQDVLDTLVADGLVTKDYVLSLLARSLGVTRVHIGSLQIDETLLHQIPKEMAMQKRAIVFGKQDDGRFKVAMEDPTDLNTIEFLAVKLGGVIEPFLASDEDLQYGFSLYEKKLTQDFKSAIEKSIDESLNLKARGALKEDAPDIPIVALVDNILASGIASRASDIHFEVLEDGVLVRERIDGILHEIIRMPKEIHAAVVARLKILSNLRVDEHTHPQDGRFRHVIGDAQIDIRVSIIPTFYGEKVELRLFSGAEKPLSLQDLGLFEDDTQHITEALKKSYGMVMVCGPTGSGKSTTLYSFMNILNRPDVNIVTIEDPVEYHMRYVNQMQVNVAAGITFASGLRALLRQDPNIIMVGEIRDQETADISVQAALTGHLLLSSVHTNDAATVVPRLVDMGVPAFLVSAVLNDIVAQRLVRKIHLECIESYTPAPSEVEAVRETLHMLHVSDDRVRTGAQWYRGKGCDACGHTGYLGRMGIFEVLHITDRLRKLIMDEGFSLDVFRAAAREEGMHTMFEDGMRKVERGLTTIEEVFRVIRE